MNNIFMNERIKKKEKIKSLFLRLVTFVVFIFFVWFAFFVYQSFKNALWDGEHQFNLVVQNEKIFVYSYHPGDGLFNILLIPEKSHMPVARGFGQYPIANIFKLGEMEGIGGGQLLSLSLEEFLAVPIDGYIIRSPQSRSSLTDQALSEVNFIPLYLCVFQNSCQTNLTSLDLLRLFLSLRQLKAGQVKLVDFSETEGLKEEELVDGSRILQSDYFVIDKLSLKLFSDEQALEEGLTVSVFNATSGSGVAKNAGRLIKNFGADLVNLGDSNEEVEKTRFSYKSEDLKDSYTLKKLADVFGADEIVFDNTIGAELKLVIGNDFKLLPQ